MISEEQEKTVKDLINGLLTEEQARERLDLQGMSRDNIDYAISSVELIGILPNINKPL